MVTRRVVSKWLRGPGHRTSGYQVATRHRSQDDWFPNVYGAFVTRRVVRKWRRCAGHRTELFPNGYEPPVTRRVVPKWTRGTGRKTSGFQLVTRHRSQGLPSGYEAPVTRRVVSKWVRDTSQKMISGKRRRDIGHKTSGFQVVMRHRSQDELFASGYGATGQHVARAREATGDKSKESNR